MAANTTFAHLTLKSSNVKTGSIPVSASSFDTCPDNCSLKNNGCYASTSPLNIHWKKITEGTRGKPFDEFLKDIESIPAGSIWRHNQAGDLQGNGKVIYKKPLHDLVKANKGKLGFTYTHYSPKLKSNRELIKYANENGFTVNLSAESIQEAIEFFDLGIAPVVTILPEDSPKTINVSGKTIVTCPATYKDTVTCESCKLCAVNTRSVIVGFPVHGITKKRAAKVFMMKTL